MLDGRTARALVVAGLAVAAQVASKAARDGVFLGAYDAAQLPRAIIIAAGLSIVAVAAMSAATRRFGPRTTVPVLFVISASLFLLEYSLLASAPRLGAAIIFGHVSCLGALLISGFWSLITDAFDARKARASLGTIGTGATFGGLVGGLSAERITALFGVETLLLVLAATQVTAALLAAGIRKKSVAKAEVEGKRPSLRELAKNRYTLKLALLVVVLASAGGLLDFLLKSSAEVRFQDPADITRFFGAFYTGTALLAFVLQASIGRRALERFGLTSTAIILPTLILVGGFAFLLIPGLAAAGFGRGSEMVMRTSIYRNAYELFYAPLSPGHRNSLKSWIDVGVERLGDALSGGLVQLLLLSAAAPRLIATSAAVLAGLAGLVVAQLGRGYVSEIEKRLSKTAEALDAAPQTMATMATLGLGGLDLARVLRRTPSVALPEEAGQPAANQDMPALPNRLLDRGALGSSLLGAGSAFAGEEGRGSLVGPSDRGATMPAGAKASPGGSIPTHVGLALRSDDVAAVRAALEEPLLPEHVPLAIELLSRDAVALEASAALAAVVDQHAGELIDALLDPEEPLSTRRRIPRILATSPTSRVRAGLLTSIRDRRFEVRVRSAEALYQMRTNGGPQSAPISDEELAALIEGELEQRGGGRLTGPLGVVGMADDMRDLAPRIYHLFLLIALAHPPKAVTSAYRASMTGDETLRGLGLEYLASVAPAAVRDELLERLDALPLSQTVSSVQLESNLLASRVAIEDALKAKGRSP